MPKPQEQPRAGGATLPDRAAEARRRRTLKMLDKRPGLRYALVVDHDASPEAVLVAISLRMSENGKVVSYELRIPRQRYDQVLFLAMLERASIH